MNPTGFYFGPAKCWTKNFVPILLLPVLCVLVTGCPHNEYTVELKPKGDVLERTLAFYRADGSNSNGVPNYQEFPSNELAAITRVYPAGAVKSEGQRHVATGEFGAIMPDDIGGAGTYSHLTTSLGTAGFYLERFRGNDDLADRNARQMRAADQITDLMIGWSKGEFGHERNWEKLHRFLDKDFRNDLKNATTYYWTAKTYDLYNTNAFSEFVARFGFYLVERHYLKLSDLPTLYSCVSDNADKTFIQLFIRPLLLSKLDIPASGPVPKSFAVINNDKAFAKSWELYLSKTDLYRAKVKEWKQKLKLNPDLAEPQPGDVTDDLLKELVGDIFEGGEPDHLVVKLALPQAPNYSNGQWRDGQVTWDARLETDRALPAFCYANWSVPDEPFQKSHFGDVILDGEELTEYCLWQNSLEKPKLDEWNQFVNNLQPGDDLKKQIEAFHFATATTGTQTNQPPAGPGLLLKRLK